MMTSKLLPSGPSFIAATCCLLALGGCGRDGTTFGLERLDAAIADGAEPSDAADPDAARDGGGFEDARFPDASTPDTSVPDAARPDASRPDTGRPDAARPDTGRPDTGTPLDGGPPPPDAGGPDATIPDVGTPDGGPTDSGPMDGGAPDTGVPCPMGCSFLDSACAVGVCARDGRTCLQRPRPDGTTCTDGDLCTVGDICRSGSCTAGPPLDCSAAGDACNLAFCDGATGTCLVQSVPDGLPCDDGNVCTMASCMSGMCAGVVSPTPGDTCLNPVAVPLVPGVSFETGNNQCAVDNAQGTCSAAGGQDIVYRLEPMGATRRLVATTEAPTMGTGYDTVLHVRSTCDMPSSLACDDDSGLSFFSQLDVVLPAAQDSFLFADAFFTNSIGDYQLRLEVDPQNTCANPSVLDPVTAPLVRGNTTGADNTFQAQCALNADSPDHVYVLTLPARTTLRIDLETVPGTPRFDTALHVRSSTCAAGGAGVIACDDDAGSSTNSRIERTFDAGTYYVVVDGFAGNSAGEYELSVTQTVALETLIFPDVGDARQPLSGDLSRRGEFVEGIRNSTLSSVSRLEVDVQIANSMTCGRAVIRVRLNNTSVGTFLVAPGQTTASSTFSGFGPVSGGSYNIRYELSQNIQPNCGTISFPDGVSTVGLGL
jgi:hypothetical protein